MEEDASEQPLCIQHGGEAFLVEWKVLNDENVGLPEIGRGSSVALKEYDVLLSPGSS